MSEPFDIPTIACFLSMVVAYFVWSDREVHTLLRLSICGIALSIANHLGNGGWPIFANILIAAAIGHALFILFGQNEPGKE
jgi:hypothetical protein